MNPLITGLMLAIGLTPYKNTKEVKMSNNERNKEIVRQLFEEVFNNRKTPLLTDLISADYVNARGEKGPKAFMTQINGLIGAFPDIHYQLQDLFGEEDKVVVSWTWHGTHKATFTTVAATGKAISNEGMAICGFKDGKIISFKLQTDRLGFWQQLGLLPANPAVAASTEAPRFIDKFLVPAAAIPEFQQRTKINRDFIRTLPGFIKDEAYQYADDNGDLICITIAEWESIEAMNKAKEAVQAEYKKEGFNPAEMMKRLNISMDRAMYHLVKN
jgi:steroid delta-isomerase-like uncharacterized protein